MTCVSIVATFNCKKVRERIYGNYERNANAVSNGSSDILEANEDADRRGNEWKIKAVFAQGDWFNYTKAATQINWNMQHFSGVETNSLWMDEARQDKFF